MIERAIALEASPAVDRWLAVLGPLLVAAAAASAALLLWSAGLDRWALAAGGIALAASLAGLLRRGHGSPAIAATASPPPPMLFDQALIGAALALNEEPAALTDGAGDRPLTVNPAYRARFGSRSPLSIGVDEEANSALAGLRETALREGGTALAAIATQSGAVTVTVRRAGAMDELLLWHFPRPSAANVLRVAAERISGATGERLAAAGVMAALIDESGMLLAANRPFADRAIAPGRSADQTPVPFSDLVDTVGDGQLLLVEEGEGARPLRGVHVPLDPLSDGGAGTFLLFDSRDEAALASIGNLQTLLEILPIGLALVDRDGRFLTMNKAFRIAAGLARDQSLIYPGDLVIKEDKAAVGDAVRRNVRGAATSGDLAVRLARQPGEPVALTVAGLRGLGEASVLLLLKDNSEEAKLKRQIAQATKMQAVGQLAGGVAHDFNNILTAIIGHCDLMLMRHTPGDSDYDDIQQIKGNSNRAAGLTRQLLAFSRQQTLRPQVVQLPDIVSEVSHLLKRLLGETVQLVVKHGRDLGPVRADPGQLEQVIVNLAVNARDAMAEKGGGTLTIQTYKVLAHQVAGLGSEILPVADYSALSVTDTGTGIAPAILGKVFEPFFTTKEVGKGTGLGLSTVYGIVKQSGGFIFAESKVGEGTSFVIYLPVHQVEQRPEGTRRAAKGEVNELWGSGTVLLVEDEPMVRTVAERALERHGYTVITATNGEEALEVIARGEPIELLISDVVMPAMDGPTMVRQARKSRPELPILFMSGYAEEQLRNSIDLANVGFLPKPFSVQELAEAVRKAIAK